jgi:hypothetical protein
MDTESESCKHLENQRVAWELKHGFRDNAFTRSRMEPLEVISIQFLGSYKSSEFVNSRDSDSARSQRFIRKSEGSSIVEVLTR